MKFLRSLYLRNFLFLVLGLNVLLFILAFMFPFLLGIAKIIFVIIMVLLAGDVLSVYRSGTLEGSRLAPERLSNGDNNEIRIHLENYYSFPVKITIIDEIPFQFQLRNFEINDALPAKSEKTLRYYLRPVKRGEYSFGALNIYVQGLLGFVSRRFIFDQGKMVEVFPSFLQMRKYELLAISNRLTELGIKKIRKLGNNMEFEQIKEYVQGDDIRTINWKATARKGNFMVNQFQDEKSQQIYCLIDKGRSMKMPFEGMTLLDYAINASLVISNIALKKEDKAGMVTFSNRIASFLPAEKKQGQMTRILQLLYKEKTAYLESDSEMLYANIKNRINQRSLLLLFTNFETLSSMKRQLPSLRKIAGNHLLVVVFFENTEIRSLLEKRAHNTEEVYLKTIAEKFAFEKKLIVKELQKYGIHSILTAPQNLTVNTINKYLEIKARNLI
ncbi:MAG: DUF58 domain-containing protein [Cytophagaceae bacterium]